MSIFTKEKNKKMIVLDNQFVKKCEHTLATVFNNKKPYKTKMRVFMRMDGMIALYHINKSMNNGPVYPNLVDSNQFQKGLYKTNKTIDYSPIEETTIHYNFN